MRIILLLRRMIGLVECEGGLECHDPDVNASASKSTDPLSFFRRCQDDEIDLTLKLKPDRKEGITAECHNRTW